MTWPRTIINWLGEHGDRVTTYLAVVSAIGAALGFLIQMHITSEEARTAHTLEYVNKFQSPQISSSYEKLFSILEEGYTQLYKAKGLAKQDVISTLVAQHKAEPDIRKLLYFYSLVTICAMNHVCDRQVTCSVFNDPVDAFRRDFYVILAKYAKEWGVDPSKPLLDLNSYCKEDGLLARLKDFL
jgi:hypothetical protein